MQAGWAVRHQTWVSVESGGIARVSLAVLHVEAFVLHVKL